MKLKTNIQFLQNPLRVQNDLKRRKIWYNFPDDWIFSKIDTINIFLYTNHHKKNLNQNKEINKNILFIVTVLTVKINYKWYIKFKKGNIILKMNEKEPVEWNIYIILYFYYNTSFGFGVLP